ncbi:hypothetical protein TNIN_95401 [Trichonephila inaurata madagascariensis]|uniref:C2H2-type domain-containing protein n=1 Tax=Trichonephila inaurata madagascariensis TaxID=2747483 RepID=A0A8X6YIR5_9ARAC|nr:hypothetical protein TNIN_95401 [Trichonephila inaurata madagascariensis]
MRVLARASPPSMQIFNMSKRVKSFSKTPTSTLRRHSRGSPIAHRLRWRHISNEQAIRLSICKLCYKRFSGQRELWDHLYADHAPSARRIEQVLSFPPEFDIEQFRQQLDAVENPVRTEPPAVMSNSSEDIPTKLSPTSSHLNRSSSCPSLVLSTLLVAPKTSGYPQTAVTLTDPPAAPAWYSPHFSLLRQHLWVP